MKTLSEFYTEDLAGKTIASVEHRYYGPIKINFTDGTSYDFLASGEPATIFVGEHRPSGPPARVWKVE